MYVKVSTGKKAAVVGAAAAAVVVILSLVALREKILEAWWLGKLDSKDPKEVEHAAERLGELRSLRAIPRLVGLVKFTAGAEITAAYDPRWTARALRPYLVAPPGALITPVPASGSAGSSGSLASYTISQTLPRFLQVNRAILSALLKIGPKAIEALLEAHGAKHEGELRDIAAIGPEVIPQLAAVLDSESAAAAFAAWEILIDVQPETEATFRSLTVALRSRHKTLRLRAAGACLMGWPEIKGASRTLLALVRDDDRAVRARAATFLGFGRQPSHAALSGLLGALADPDLAVRGAAADAVAEVVPCLRSSAPERARAVDALLPLLSDGDEVTAKAALALRALGPDARRAVPGLVALLDAASAEVRAAACKALGAIGSDAPLCLPALIAHLGDTSDVAEAALVALRAFGPEARAAAPLILARLEDWEKSFSLHAAAILALGAVGREAAPAIPALLALLDRKQGDVEAPAAAAASLVEIASGVAEVIAALRRAVQDPDRDDAIRVASATALTRTPLPRRELVSILQGLLKDPSTTLVSCAVTLLGKLGPEARPALPEIRSLFQPTREDALAFGLALWEIDRDAETVLPAILTAAGPFPTRTGRHWAPCPCLRFVAEAAPLLDAMGPKAREMSPSLVRLLVQADRDVRRKAAWALWRVDPGNLALSSAVSRLVDEDLESAEADEVLLMLGSRCVPRLTARLGEPGLRGRLRALDRLGRLGKQAAGAVLAIEGLLRDPEEEVRWAAEDALERIRVE